MRAIRAWCVRCAGLFRTARHDREFAAELESHLQLHIDEKVQSRVDELAARCNEGQLTPGERAEYEAYVQASTLIGILQSKARRALAHVQL